MAVKVNVIIKGVPTKFNHLRPTFVKEATRVVTAHIPGINDDHVRVGLGLASQEQFLAIQVTGIGKIAEVSNKEHVVALVGNSMACSIAAVARQGGLFHDIARCDVS